MADSEAQERAEKLAAGKKRYEQLKKQKEKGKRGGGVKKKEEEISTKPTTPPPEAEPGTASSEQEPNKEKEGHTPDEIADLSGKAEKVPEEGQVADQEGLVKPKHGRQPSLSLESRMRSASFRRASLTKSPLSPPASGPKSPSLPALNADEESMTEIYRKQAARVDELEKENRRLTKEAREGEGRWRALEAELEELQESRSGDADLRHKADRVATLEEELNQLKLETTSLKRQNSQLQSQKSNRHASSSTSANSLSSAADLQAQLDSKQSTIETMELELSSLRAQISKSSSSGDSHQEQISALEEKLRRAEGAAGAAQRELLDLRRNLDRASEKAVKDGTARISTETKLKSLEREAADSKKSAEESIARVDMLEKKLAALTNLHKEAEARRQAGDRTRDRLENEVAKLRKRSAALENENLRLREERERTRRKDASSADAADDDDLDELEDEERRRFQHRIRDLEGEVSDLRRGIWRDKRRELDAGNGPGSPNGNFDEIDLSGPSPSYRRPSMTTSNQGRVSDFTNVLTSGFNALTGGGLGADDHDGLLDDDFDEGVYRQAQEDEAKKEKDRLEGIKAELKQWEGWRMDIADSRVGTVEKGMGEIFEI